jgi:triacylglycerol lipase
MGRFLRTVVKARRWDVTGLLEHLGKSNRVERRTDFSRCERPVLLLYGFFSTRRTFEVLERRLRRDGYGVFSLDLGGLARCLNTRGIDDLAAYVRAKVERIYARNPGLGPLTIIGHSKGGLIGAYYVKRLGGWRRTRAVVTLGTPHQGTPVAWLGLPLIAVSPSVWQMRPGSAFLRRLADGAWPPEVRLTSIFSRRDGTTPYPCALLQTHGLPHLANIEVDARHHELIRARRVYDVLLAELREGEATAPAKRGPVTVFRGGKAVAPEPGDGTRGRRTPVSRKDASG